MASSSSSALFQPSQISSSVSADDALQFLEDQGVFYQEDAEIGKLVDDLFTAGRQRSEDVRLHYFRPRLEQDPVSKTRIAFAHSIYHVSDLV